MDQWICKSEIFESWLCYCPAVWWLESGHPLWAYFLVYKSNKNSSGKSSFMRLILFQVCILSTITCNPHPTTSRVEPHHSHFTVEETEIRHKVFSTTPVTELQPRLNSIPMVSSADSVCPISAHWSGDHSGCPTLHGTHLMFAEAWLGEF